MESRRTTAPAAANGRRVVKSEVSQTLLGSLHSDKALRKVLDPAVAGWGPGHRQVAAVALSCRSRQVPLGLRQERDHDKGDWRDWCRDAAIVL